MTLQTLKSHHTVTSTMLTKLSHFDFLPAKYYSLRKTVEERRTESRFFLLHHSVRWHILIYKYGQKRNSLPASN